MIGQIPITFLLLSVLNGYVDCYMEPPIVNTESGRVRGIFSRNEDGDHFFYMGIPYATIQENNIFGDPVEVKPWNGIFEATDQSIICPQREQYNHTIKGHPDCMNLHVYVPAKPTTLNPLPVYVFIYGGAFVNGDASLWQWGPQMLTVHDVIVVMMNYRSGIFGFMCLDIPEIPGNAGFKDIIRGLRWVQKNIAAFGGDPNSVTLGGSSSGANAVEWVVSSPISEGLFHRLIFESGSATTLKRVPTDSKEYILDVAQTLGLEGELTIQNAWKFVQQHTVEEIILATEELDIVFYGCVEKEFEGVERLASALPGDVLASGDFHAVDVLTGFNSKEGLVYVGVLNLTEENARLFELAVKGFIFIDDEEKNKTIELIRRFYIGDEPVSNNVKSEMIDLYSDNTFVYPVLRAAQFYAKYANVYLYEFAYDGDHNFAKQYFKVYLPGVSHADEIGYLFRQDSYYKRLGIGFNATDKIIMDRFTTMITNFVKYGNPTPEITVSTPVIWEPIKGTETNYLKIDLEMVMAREPLQQRMALWDLLYYTFYTTRKTV